MLFILLIGLPVNLLCLLLQALFVIFCMRRIAIFKKAYQQEDRPLYDMLMLSFVMLLMLLCNFLQISLWAALFLLLGEFDDFATALYHSAVNFTTLGYGDIIMSPARPR